VHGVARGTLETLEKIKN